MKISNTLSNQIYSFSTSPVGERNGCCKYGETVALSLISLAERDGRYASYLRRRLADAWPLPESKFLGSSMPSIKLGYLEPLSEDIARRRTDWLLANLTKPEIAGAAPALLRSWAKGEETPKSIVIGIVGLAIPGITLGLIKKRVGPMNCLVNAEAGLTSAKLMRLVAQVTHGVVAAALKAANYNLSSTDPDLSDWLFGEREIVIYEGSAQTMAGLKRELAAMGIAAYAAFANDKILVLAMSPSVNGLAIADVWKFKQW